MLNDKRVGNTELGKGGRGAAQRHRLTPVAAALSALLALAAQAPAQAAPRTGAWFAASGQVQSQTARNRAMPGYQPNNPAQRQQAQTRQNLQRSLDKLNRTASSIAAQQAMQQAARQRAIDAPSDIPDGLAEGGLRVDVNPATLGWRDAAKPVQRNNGGRTEVLVTQTGEKAILNWETFNVGKNTTVRFDQSAGTVDGKNGWVALNRINDPSGRPSRIAGQIQAEGSVYLVNRNGVIFHGSSQVDTRALVASTLALSDEQFDLGINNPRRIGVIGGNDYGLPQFGEHASGGDFGQEYVPSYVPGEVQVDAGAQLKVGDGGKLMLFGTKVRNSGRLQAVDGQVIMAAGEQVWLTSDLSGVRGLDVAVSAPASRLFNYSDLTGALGLGTIWGPFGIHLRDVIQPQMEARAKEVGYQVSNTGLVDSQRGDITLQAREVLQDGVLTATSALNNREGSIRLRAWGQGMLSHSSSLEFSQMANWSAGTLTLTPGSVTLITPDPTDTGEIEQSALATRYKTGSIDLRGNLIDVQSRANVVAPSGQISLVANRVPISNPGRPVDGSAEEPFSGEKGDRDGSRVYLDSDAFLSVAGLRDVLVPMARNFVDVELRINELRDSPLQRDSWLRGQKVTVDRRASGSFDGGPMAGVQWVQEGGAYVPGAWAGTPLADATGWIGVGKTDLQELSTAGGQIVLKAGGSVITRQGSLLDISGGTVRYGDGINRVTWLQGANGRVYAMDRAMPDIAYLGLAGVYKQSSPRWGVDREWKNPLMAGGRAEKGYVEGRTAGAIAVYGGEALVLEGDFWAGTTPGDRQDGDNAPRGGELVVGGGSDPDRIWSMADLRISRTPTVLPTDFKADTPVGAGFYHPDPVGVAASKTSWLNAATLGQADFGSIELYATHGFTLEQGTVLELAPRSSFTVQSNAPVTSGRTFHVDGAIRVPGGRISIGTAGAGLNSLTLGAGAVIDVSGQWVNGPGPTWPGMAPAIHGGSIDLSAGHLVAAPGVVLDVSGGGWVVQQGGRRVARAGDAGSISMPAGQGVALEDLDFRAYAAGSGGTLRLEAGSDVQIGGVAPAQPGVLHMPDTLYADRGFRRVAVTALGDIVVPDGVQVAQLPRTIDLSDGAYLDLPTGSDILQLGALRALPVELRGDRGQAALELSAHGNLSIGAGAAILTDVGGRIGLAGGAGGSITVLGTVEAPAGSIDITAQGALRVAPGGALLARGVPVLYVGSRGYRTGRVLPGGSIALDSTSMQLERGSLVDVSGAAGVIEIAPPAFGKGRPEPVQVSSDAGSISIEGVGMIEGSLVGRPGGPGAEAGRLRFEHSAPPAGDSPGPVLDSILTQLDPTCYFAPYTCESNPDNAIGFDLSVILASWGYTDLPPMILTRELVDLLRVPPSSALVVSDDAPPPPLPSGPLDPASFGLSASALDAFRDYVFGSDFLRDNLASPPRGSILMVRPSAFADGGFADLSLSSAAGIHLDGVRASAGRSINLAGLLANAGTRDSTLIAPYISLTGDRGPAAAATSRQGRLALQAGTVEITNVVSVRGFERTVLQADDIRLSATAQTNGLLDPTALDVDGPLLLRAGQVYPGTGVKATIRSAESIVVEQGNPVAAPWSAAGQLTLEAPVIEQGGTLRAPFGQIVLKASEKLVLLGGGVVSVSGDGLILPYGWLSNGEFWIDPTKSRQTQDPAAAYLNTPPEKRILLDAPVVESQAGSVIDIRGGGDLYANEFVPGPGGSHNVLADAGVYAIAPGYRAPMSPSGTQGSLGQQIWLEGAPGLAAGWYTLLPAQYAALPGAFAVSLAGPGPATTGRRAVVLNDGSAVVAGRLGNALTGTREALPSYWRVMPGAAIRQYSEFNEALANDYFSSEGFKLTQYRVTGKNVVTPRLPRDGGAVVFKATDTLVLDGALRSQPGEGGRGGLVDIAGEKIAIVGRNQDGASLRADGYLVIDAASLSSFGAGSLLVGGTRTGDLLGLRLDLTASDIVVRNDADSALIGPEIILAATDLVNVDAGSVIRAQGEASAGAGDLVMTPQQAPVYTDPEGWDDGNPADDVLTTPGRDWGALIRVSNGDVTRVLRDGVDTTIGGLVSVGAGAEISGGRALLIDATRDTQLAGSARLAGLDLSVASGRIGIGGGSEGLVLEAATLAQLANTQTLTLRSYSTIDFHGSVDLGAAGLRKVAFDAAALAGYGDGAITVRGGTIVLTNTGAVDAPASGVPGSGSLTLDADTLVLGGGSKAVRGFHTVVLGGREQIVGEGNGSIDLAQSSVTLDTALLTGLRGASQSLTTGGALRVVGNPSRPVGNGQDSLGASLALTGGTVEFAGRAMALGGSVSLTATRGNLIVADGALIDVSGFAKTFYDVQAYADAGRVGLTAVGADVRVASGAHLNLAADADGGSAGSLAVAASGGGVVSLDGRIDAQAGAAGQGGSFSLDIDALADFAGLSERLNGAGFFAARQFRIRNGDLVIDGATTVADFSLVADRGQVTLAGAVDATAPYGGLIAVTGGNGLVMLPSARLKAGSSSELGGGRITLEAMGGELDLRGGVLDVAGGDGGRVRLRALQNAAHDDVAVMRLDASIVGARSAVLEGVTKYENVTSVAAVKGQAVQDALDFAANAPAIAARLGNPAVAVMPGIEISSNGDLTVESDWNLWQDFAAVREGGLTLRAAGNLVVNGNISDGFAREIDYDVLVDAASWDLRLVAGADLSSASSVALSPLAGLANGSGSLVVGSADAGRHIRTGSGDIAVRAGRDVRLADNDSVIYTAGRRDMTVFDDFVAKPIQAIGGTIYDGRMPGYGVYGGNLDLAAQGDVSTTLRPGTGEIFGRWLRRTGNINSDGYFGPYTTPGGHHTGEQASWWIEYGDFQQGVGALGGGNVRVDAGGDLIDLLVALPTNGRVRGGRTAGERMLLELRNGGALNVSAGGAIRGGQYYVGRGAGSVDAGTLANGRSVSSVDQYGGLTVYDVAPVLALGDASLDVRASGDLRVQSVIDPLMTTLPLGTDYWGSPADYGSYMLGQTAAASLSLTSVGGDVTLVGQTNHIARDGNPADGVYLPTGKAGNIYPALTRITAMNGSFVNKGLLMMLPGEQTELRILADQDVHLGLIRMARGNWEGYPTPLRAGAAPDLPVWTVNAEPSNGTPFVNPEALLLAGDHEASRIYANEGSIVGLPPNIFEPTVTHRASLVSAEQTWLRAGNDIRGIAYAFRNNHATDVSVVHAGNDIIAGFGPGGSQIDVEGTGAVLVTAGRDVYGGASTDNVSSPAESLNVTTRGNRMFDSNNRSRDETILKALPEQSAAITVIAGLQGSEPDYAAFMAAYLDPANVASMPGHLKAAGEDGTVLPVYLTDLVEARKTGDRVARRGLTSFVEQVTGDRLEPLAAWQRFLALPQLTQQRFLRRIYMQELRDAGRDQNQPGADGTPRNGGYNRGYDAIAKLFPGEAWNGDVWADSLKLRTMAGGDIEVLTPGGSLQVAGLGTAVTAGAGIITLGSGHIDIFAHEDVVVNRSRILTFVPEATDPGSDMVIWSSVGDIDAGRGAKTLRVPSAPDVVTGVDAITEILERSDMSGSGIGTVGDGDVDLVAPEGTINFGDAGVRVAGNFNIAALQILNAANLEVQGEVTGMPEVVSINTGALTAASSASTAASTAAADMATRQRNEARRNLPSIISVQVLGFGNEPAAPAPRSTDPQRSGARGTAAQPVAYDPDGVVELVGQMDLTPPQLARLTETEQRNLRR
ncbi:filamentous haemagglutinin family protein [Bordetella genomosp. 13]|nr:filamentous haemagglutinin family protein [Bordetella genomosp. 13]